MDQSGETQMERDQDWARKEALAIMRSMDLLPSDEDGRKQRGRH